MSDDTPSRPVSDAWTTLLKDLQEAKRLASRPESKDFPRPDLQSVIQAHAGVHKFLTAHPEIVGKQLHVPIIHLTVALADLGQGRRSKLLRPIPRKRPTGIAQQSLMALAALALDEMVVGQEMRIVEAAAKVARTIEAARLPVQARSDSKLSRTVIGYRQRLMTGKGAAPLAALHVWKTLREQMRQDGLSPAKRVEWLLQRLRTAPGLHWN